MRILEQCRIYVYVGLVAALSWWLVQLTDRDDVTQGPGNQEGPDFFSNGYYKQEMGTDGLVKSELVAQSMEHIKASGETLLKKPVMTLHDHDKAPWIIRADQALLSNDGDHLKLMGDNLIQREAYKRDAALIVKTSELLVTLSTHFAKTQAWAEIISPPQKTSGVGMEATFVSPIHLTFFSKVKGRYEIN